MSLARGTASAACASPRLRRRQRGSYVLFAADIRPRDSRQSRKPRLIRGWSAKADLEFLLDLIPHVGPVVHKLLAHRLRKPASLRRLRSARPAFRKPNCAPGSWESAGPHASFTSHRVGEGDLIRPGLILPRGPANGLQWIAGRAIMSLHELPREPGAMTAPEG